MAGSRCSVTNCAADARRPRRPARRRWSDMRDAALEPPLREAKASCPYCGTGCGVILQARGAQIVGVRGDPDHLANFGRLCPKGRTLHLTAAREVIDTQRVLH